MRHVEEARLRRHEKLRRTRGRQSLILLAIIAAVVLIIVIGYFVLNSDFWLIKTITVFGNDRLSVKEVVALSGVDYKTNLLKLPAGQIETDIKKSPWVKEVELFRGLPNRLTIQIKERRPFVGLKQGDKVFVVDKSGFVIQAAAELTTETPVPVISEIKAPTLRVGARRRGRLLAGALKSLNRIAPDLWIKVTWISVPSLEKLTFQTTDGLEIVYGGAGSASKKNYL